MTNIKEWCFIHKKCRSVCGCPSAIDKPDPITNRLLSDECWNSHHREEHFDKLLGRNTIIGCAGWRTPGEPCECGCHEYVKKRKVKPDPNASLSLIDVYGTIQIGEEKTEWRDE